MPDPLQTELDLEKNTSFLRMRDDLRFYAQKIESVYSGSGFEFGGPVSGPLFRARAKGLPKSDDQLITWGQAKQFFSPQALRLAFLDRQWNGIPVSPFPPADPGTGGDGPEPVPPGAITGLTGTFSYTLPDIAGDRYLVLHVTFNYASAGLYDGIRIYYQRAGDVRMTFYNDMPTDPESSSFSFDIGDLPHMRLPAVTANTVYTVYIDPYKNGVYAPPTPKDQPDPLPYVDIAVTPPPNADAGIEYAGVVTLADGYTNFVERTYFYDANGAYRARLTVRFKNPANDVRFAGVEVVKFSYADAGGSKGALVYEEPLGKILKSGETIEVGVPSVVEHWDLALLSFDKEGKRNTYQSGVTPLQMIAIGEANGKFDLTKYDPSKTTILSIVGGKVVLTTGAVTDNNILRQGAGRLLIIDSDIATNAVKTNHLTAGIVSSEKLAADEILVGGGGSKPGKFGVYGYLGTAIGFIGVVGAPRTGFVNTYYQSAEKTNVAWVSGALFDSTMVGSIITIAGLEYLVETYVAPDLVTIGIGIGNLLNAAYSAPAQEGAWLKSVSIGGTGYSNSRIRAAQNGDVFIRNATFRLDKTENPGPTQQTYRVMIDGAYTTFAGMGVTFTGVNVRNNGSSLVNHRALLINRGVVAKNMNGWTVGALVSYNGDPTGTAYLNEFWGECYVCDAVGNITASLTGNTGTVMATAMKVWSPYWGQYNQAQWRLGVTAYFLNNNGDYVYFDQGVMTYIGRQIRN